MTNHYSASCQCGQLSLTLSRPPVTQLTCHCRDCRALSNAAFTQVAFFVAEPQAVRGESRHDSHIGGSGQPKHNHSCPTCGDFVYAKVEVLKGLVAVNAACLVTPFEFTADAHVWTSQKLPEVKLPDGTVTFPKAPSLNFVLNKG